MAATNLDTTKITLTKETLSTLYSTAAATAAILNQATIDATDGAYFTADKGCDYLLVIRNIGGTTRTVTVAAGTFAPFGAAALSISLTASKEGFLWISNIGQYIIASGTNKGKVKLTATHGDAYVTVVELKKFPIAV